jgi:predicted RNase H-like HicB family nuclease
MKLTKLMNREYTVIYERGKRNWSAYVPDLPGCIATGKTHRQLERTIREAIEFHIEGLLLHGEPVPEPTVEAGKVRVVA